MLQVSHAISCGAGLNCTFWKFSHLAPATVSLRPWTVMMCIYARSPRCNVYFDATSILSRHYHRPPFLPLSLCSPHKLVLHVLIYVYIIPKSEKSLLESDQNNNFSRNEFNVLCRMKIRAAWL